MAQRKTVVHEVCGSTLVMARGAHIQAADWDGFIAAVRSASYTSLLVYADGGSLSANQRNAFRQAVKPDVPMAVLAADTAVTQGTSTLRMFLGENLRAFGPDDLDSPFDHLQLSPEERALVTNTLIRLRAELRA